MRKLPFLSLALLLGLGAAGSALPLVAQAQIGISISVGFAPPALPYYEQPRIPGYGYIWTPGYWAWDGYVEDYYWVPGTWVLPPRIGLYWTPPYWGWRGGDYVFNSGYWGPTIGFYGGINYGYGYDGYGYGGGYWDRGNFFYNRRANNIANSRINTVYDRAVINNSYNRASYNGGPAGVNARPTPQQLALAPRDRFGATPLQLQHIQTARSAPALRAGVNHGAPPIAATAIPNAMRGPGVIPAARAGAPYRVPQGAGPRGPGFVGPNRGPNPNGEPRFAPNAQQAPHAFGGPREQSYRPTQAQGPARYNGAEPYRQAPQPHYEGAPRPPQGYAPSRAPQEFRGPPREQQEFRAPPRAPQEFRAPQRAPQEFRAPQRPAPQMQAAPRPQQGPRLQPAARPQPGPSPQQERRPDEKPPGH